MQKTRKKLIEVRNNLCLSQREFAQFLDIPQGTYWGYETGRRSPRPIMIRKIVDKLKQKGVLIEYSDLMEN